MSRSPSLEDLLAYVAKRHAGQKDKAGQPYIFHVLRVMLRMETAEEQIVALLHDVLEDTVAIEVDLREMEIPEQIVRSVVVLTRKEGERYQAYIVRCGKDTLARKVKIADLEDHLTDTWAISREMHDRYNNALAYLDSL